MTPQDLAKELAARRPSRLKVVLNDDATQMVAVPRGRQRWSRAAATIDQLAWAEVQCLDGRNELIGVVKRGDEPAALESLTVPTTDPSVTQANALALIITRAVTDAHKAATQASLDLVRGLRTTMAGELKDILDAYKNLAANAFDRALAAESDLQHALAERNAERESELAQREGESTEGWRDRVLRAVLDDSLGGGKKAPGGVPGGHGPNGAGS